MGIHHDFILSEVLFHLFHPVGRHWYGDIFRKKLFKISGSWQHKESDCALKDYFLLFENQI